MKYKLKNGLEIDLHEEDIKNISEMHEREDFDFEDMEEYFKDLHKHAISKMEMISHKVITDEDSIDMAMEYVAKFGSYNEFAKMLRYMADYNLAFHLLEASK